MAYSHVPHDALIEDWVTLSNASQVAGHTWIGEGANIGLGVEIRQRLAIGPYAMVGMSSTVTADIPPFAVAIGSPARITGGNRVGLLRRGIADEDTVARIDGHYKGEWEGPPDFLSGDLAELVDRFRAHSSGRIAGRR
jgi:UDP-N-acetylglucosamine acyltransferase